MRFFNIKNKNNKLNSARAGFTLIETMVAVFILSIALTSLLGLTSKSLFMARYSRNEITANYLLQEASDYIRNKRDSVAFQQKFTTNNSWSKFLAIFGNSASSSLCFSTNGCYFDVNATTNNFVIKTCSVLKPTFGKLKCPVFYYDPNATNGSFYNYNSGIGALSNFKRMIFFKKNPNNLNEIYITIKVEWLNGNLVQSQSLYLSLLNWFGSQ